MKINTYMLLTLNITVFILVIESFCIFVSHECFRRNPKLFIYDKALPMGNNTERFVSPFLERSCNPKGNAAHKNFFDMHEKKDFVTTGVFAGVTPVTSTLTQLEILKTENALMRQLATASGFFVYFFEKLPFYETQQACFEYCNALYATLFNEPRYQDFKHFKTSVYGNT